MNSTPQRCATCCAALRDHAKVSAETLGARRLFPLSQANPARLHPIVPLRSAATLFGTPALISDCAPMMLRVRPAQLTPTSVSGDGAMSRARSTSSAPGTLVEVGLDTAAYSLKGRLSSTTRSAPL